MDFSPTITRASEVAAGVTYTIKRLSFIERAKRDAAIAEHQHRAGELMDELIAAKDGARSIKDALAAIMASPDLRRKLTEREDLMTLHVVPAVVRAGLVSIDGLTVEGKPMTVEQFLALADRDLIFEAYGWCDAASSMTAEALKNLQSLGIFETPADGPSENTNAPNAAATNSTATETAAGTTPVM